MDLMGKYVTIDGEQIPLEQDNTVRDVKDYYGAADDDVMIYRPDDGDTITLTDSDVVLEHIPNEAEVSLQPETEQVDDDYHVVFDNERYFVDLTETAGEFKDRVGASNTDVLTFAGPEGPTRLDDNVTLQEHVPSGAITATMPGGQGVIWG